MTTEQTRDVATTYFQAWSTRQGPDALRPLMAEDFTFRAGEMVIEGRDAFLESGGWPDHAVTTLLAESYDGNTAFQLYEGRNGDATVKIADHLTVEDGRIASAEVICDGAAFMEFMAAG
ncbi:MAG: nuclear transport factor 2 family protein [Actinomycetota bacterium]